MDKKVQVNRFEMFERMKNPDLENGINIYNFNQKQILKSDAVVAFLDYPSHGVGMEIQIAHANLKKILFLKEDSGPLSKMVTDIARLNLAPVLNYSRDHNSERVVSVILKSLGIGGV